MYSLKVINIYGTSNFKMLTCIETIAKDFSKSENYVYVSFHKKHAPNITR